LILNFHVVDHRDLFISRPFALLKFEVSHPNIRKCVGKSWVLMKQKANMLSIETGSLDNPDPGIRGRDYADVLTNHDPPTSSRSVSTPRTRPVCSCWTQGMSSPATL